MTPDMVLKLRKSLVEHEGYRNHLYKDTLGNYTIGIGFNIGERGLSDDWINTQYQQDVAYFYDQLSRFAWFHHLNEDRQVVLIDMAFMGIKRFMEFHEMLAALEARDYEKAADEMLNSVWAEQVKGRAISLANGMRTGIYNP